MAMNKIIFSLLSVLVIFGCVTNGEMVKTNFNSRQEYVNTYPEMSLEIKQTILEGKVIKGMTKADVLAAWGNPSRIEENGEVWCYDPSFFSFSPKKVVSFTPDGIVYDFAVFWGG